MWQDNELMINNHMVSHSGFICLFNNFENS